MITQAEKKQLKTIAQKKGIALSFEEDFIIFRYPDGREKKVPAEDYCQLSKAIRTQT